MTTSKSYERLPRIHFNPRKLAQKPRAYIYCVINDANGVQNGVLCFQDALHRSIPLLCFLSGIFW